MTIFHRYQPSRLIRQASLAILSLILLASVKPVLAGEGHGDSTFSAGEGKPADKVEVDATVARRLGINVEPVTQRRLAVAIKTVGQIENLPSKQADVNTPINQVKVVELLVEPGESVQSGQVVAVLSSPGLVELRVNSISQRAEAEADLQQAIADLKLAQENYQRYSQIAAKEIAQAQTEIKFFQEKYDRDSQLAEQGAIPRRTALESETQLAEAQTQLSTASSKQQVISAENQVKRAQAAVRVAQSRLALSDTQYRTRLQQLGIRANDRGLVTVTAPISGRVATREATLGQAFEDAGGKLMTIIDDSSVFATANIYEKDLSKVRRGQQVRVKVASIPDRTFTGTIAVVGSVVEGQRRVVPVKAKLANSRGELKPGMFANLEVLTDQTTAATLAIPSEAVIDAQGKNIVFLQQDNSYKSVEVTLGKTSGTLVEIKEGLSAGDRVVTQGAVLLYSQSLKAAGEAPPSEDEHGGGHEEEEETANPASASPTLSLPPWLLAISGIGAIAAAFWVGRRTRPRSLQAAENFQDGSEVDLNGASNNDSKQLQHSSSAEDKSTEDSKTKSH